MTINPTITAEFRDYPTGVDPETGGEGVLSLNTAAGGDATFTFQYVFGHREETVTVEFTPEQARGLGIDLMQWIGSRTCTAYDDYVTANGAGFELDVQDGIAEFTAAHEGAVLGFAPSYEQARDIAQRLIILGGVDLGELA